MPTTENLEKKRWEEVEAEIRKRGDGQWEKQCCVGKHRIWYPPGDEEDGEEEDERGDGWTGSTQTREQTGRQKMKSMAERAGGELLLPQRPHN